MTRQMRFLGLLFVGFLMAGCATTAKREPLNVSVAGIEMLQGQGLEIRLLLKLRVQNPNDAALNYNGAAINLIVQGKSFASGVNSESGVIPRFGEAVVGVPVTVSVMRMARQFIGMLDGKPFDKIVFQMDGKLSGTGFSTQRFSSKGEFKMPSGPGVSSSVKTL